MPESAVIKYVRDTRAQGFSDDNIRAALSQQGWTPQEIEEAMKAAGGKKPSSVKGPQSKPKETADKRPSGKEAHEDPGSPPADLVEGIMTGGFILTAVGGLIIIANAILVYASLGDILQFFVPNIGVSFLNYFNITLSSIDNLLINLIIGAFLVGSSYINIAMPDKKSITGIFVIVLSMIAVMIGNGFLIGGIISIAGGVFAFLDR